MATGNKSDFQIFEEQFFGGMFEVLQRNVDLFNEASQNTMRIRTQAHRGDFLEESFFQEPSSLISDRDPTSTASATATKLTQDEFKFPKVNKRIGPVENTIDSFKKIGQDPDLMGFILGQQSARRVQSTFVESAVSGLVGTYSVTGVANELVQDATDGSLETTDLARGLQNFGDAAQDIRLWVMHSKVYYDLLVNQIGAKLLEVTAFNIFEGSPATLGRPVLVTDSPALFSAGSSTASSTDDVYWTFGLAEGGVDIFESEDRSAVNEIVTGLNNLVMRWQAEYAYTVGIKGMQWDTTVNPSDSALATSSHWTQVAADKKSLPGVAIKSR